MLGKRWRIESFRPDAAKVVKSRRRAQAEKKASISALDTSEHSRSLKSTEESQEKSDTGFSQPVKWLVLSERHATSNDGREQQAAELTHQSEERS